MCKRTEKNNGMREKPSGPNSGQTGSSQDVRQSITPPKATKPKGR